jgi:hypothetical protein
MRGAAAFPFSYVLYGYRWLILREPVQAEACHSALQTPTSIPLA